VGLHPSAVGVDERSDRVFVPNLGEATVSVLDARSGVVLRTMGVGQAPAALAVAPQTDRVYIANSGDATVSVLDAWSGSVIRTVAVGLQPEAVAVDGQTGAVVVGNAGGPVPPTRAWWPLPVPAWWGWLPPAARHTLEAWTLGSPARTGSGSVSVLDRA